MILRVKTNCIVTREYEPEKSKHKSGTFFCLVLAPLVGPNGGRNIPDSLALCVHFLTTALGEDLLAGQHVLQVQGEVKPGFTCKT